VACGGEVFLAVCVGSVERAKGYHKRGEGRGEGIVRPLRADKRGEAEREEIVKNLRPWGKGGLRR